MTPKNQVHADWLELKAKAGGRLVMICEGSQRLKWLCEDAHTAGQILGRPLEEASGLDLCWIEYHNYAIVLNRLNLAGYGVYSAVVKLSKSESGRMESKWVLSELYDPEPLTGMDWDGECAKMEADYPALHEFLNTWAPHCGSTREIFRGQLCRMLKANFVIEIPFE